MSECSCLVSQFAHACRLCFITERAEQPPTRFTEPRAIAGQRCPESGLGDAMFYIVVRFFELMLPRNPDLHKAAIELNAPDAAGPSGSESRCFAVR